MDFPEAKYYGVRCCYCECDFFVPASKKGQIELMISRLMPSYIRTASGLIVGFGFENYNHFCKPSEDL